jgi:hypothetical protein
MAAAGTTASIGRLCDGCNRNTNELPRGSRLYPCICRVTVYCSDVCRSQHRSHQPLCKGRPPQPQLDEPVTTPTQPTTIATDDDSKDSLPSTPSVVILSKQLLPCCA